MSHNAISAMSTFTNNGIHHHTSIVSPVSHHHTPIVSPVSHHQTTNVSPVNHHQIPSVQPVSHQTPNVSPVNHDQTPNVSPVNHHQAPSVSPVTHHQTPNVDVSPVNHHQSPNVDISPVNHHQAPSVSPVTCAWTRVVSAANHDETCGMPVMNVDVMPAMSVDVMPAMSINVMPAMSVDVMPAMSIDVMPAMSINVMPAMSVDVMPAMSVDVMPAMSVDVMPAMSVDVMPAMSVDVMPAMSVDVMPAMSVDVMPAMSVDVMPAMGADGTRLVSSVSNDGSRDISSVSHDDICCLPPLSHINTNDVSTASTADKCVTSEAVSIAVLRGLSGLTGSLRETSTFHPLCTELTTSQSVRAGLASSQSVRAGLASSQSVRAGLASSQSVRAGLASSQSVRAGLTSSQSVRAGLASSQTVKTGNDTCLVSTLTSHGTRVFSNSNSDMTHCSEGHNSPDMTHCSEGHNSPDITHCSEGHNSPDITHCSEGHNNPDITHCSEGHNSPDITHCSEGHNSSDSMTSTGTKDEVNAKKVFITGDEHVDVIRNTDSVTSRVTTGDNCVGLIMDTDSTDDVTWLCGGFTVCMETKGLMSSSIQTNGCPRVKMTEERYAISGVTAQSCTLGVTGQNSTVGVTGQTCIVGVTGQNSTVGVTDQTSTVSVTGQFSAVGVTSKPQPTSANNRLPPCRVCGDPASGLHYGVNSCEACKRFFRRAMKRTRNFKCRGQKNCLVKGKKNNLCGYCRYKRCLALGMSPTAIKTGRYTHEKRAQDMMEVQQLGSSSNLLVMQEEEVLDIVHRLVAVHSKVITNSDVPEVEMYRRAEQVREAVRLKQEVFGFSDTLSAEQYNEVFQVTGLDVDERKQHMECVAKALDVFVHGYVRFGKGVPGFSSLSLTDQANLLKLARCEVWFLSAYKGFLTHLQVFYAPNRDCRHKSDVERLLGKDYTRTAFQLAGRLQALHLTVEEVIVLKAVCLTFADRCNMDNAEHVEQIQWRMLRCLLHLLQKNHADRTKFHKVMDWLTSVRNLTELSQKALASTHFAHAIRKNATLVDLILI